MSDISREELGAFTEANSKLSVALEKITDALILITQKQDKILDKISNGMIGEIVNGVNSHYNDVHKETISSLGRVEANQGTIKTLITDQVPTSIGTKLDNSTIARDIQHVKWFVAIVGLLIIIATTVVRGLDNRDILNKHDQPLIIQTQALTHLLETHMTNTEGAKSNGTTRS
jgi:hypothetical protein